MKILRKANLPLNRFFQTSVFNYFLAQSFARDGTASCHAMNSKWMLSNLRRIDEPDSWWDLSTFAADQCWLLHLNKRICERRQAPTS